MAVSETEVASRVALLKRFRALLFRQRERFESYVAVLDKQKDSIETASVEDLAAHIELEEKIVADILAIQKVIEPMRDVIPKTAFAGYPDAANIEAAIEALRGETAARVVRNKDLLSTRMDAIQAELKALRGNPFARRKSLFAAEQAPGLIDIKG